MNVIDIHALSLIHISRIFRRAASSILEREVRQTL